MRWKLRRIPHMLYYRMVRNICCIIFPVFIAMALFNLYSIHVVEAQVGASVRSTLNLYMNQVDIQLEMLRLDITDLAASDEDVLILDSMEPCNKRTLAKVRLTNTLSRYPVISNMVDMAFYFSPGRELRTAVYDTDFPYSARTGIWMYFQKTYSDPSTRRTCRWNYVDIGGSLYLLFLAPSKSGMVGVVIGFDKLLRPLQDKDMEFHGTILVRNDRGTPLTHRDFVEEQGIDLSLNYSENYVSGATEDYLVIGVDSTEADIGLAGVINEANLLEGLPALHKVLLLLCAMATAGLGLLLMSMRQIFIKPLRVLTKAMEGFGNGDLDTVISAPATSEEMALVYSSFNSMSQEIKNLKIAVYEERLQKQKTELQYLQLQINPHFYINCINIIYNLAEQENYLLIQEMSALLSNYFRCIFTDDMSFVPLKDELYQISLYMGIEKLRYPDCFTYQVDVPDYLGTASLPRFVLMTFAENAVKHGISTENILNISISGKLTLLDTEPAIELTVQDNGGGFPPEVLSMLRQKNYVAAMEVGHIGISNAIQRLELLYGSCYQLDFRNCRGGAAVELTIPLKSEEVGAI